MTLTLSPEVERALEQEAARRGTTPDELVEETLRAKLKTPQETTEERRARIQSLKGSMAHLGPSLLLEDRAEDRRGKDGAEEWIRSSRGRLKVPAGD